MATFSGFSWWFESPLLLQTLSLFLIALGICRWYIDIREGNVWALIYIRILIGAVFLLIVWWQIGDIYMFWNEMSRSIAAWILLLIAMSYLIYAKQIYHLNSIRVKPRPLMSAGMWTYALLCSAIMAFLIVGSYPYIPFDCTQLQDYSRRLVVWFTSPMTQGFIKVQSSVSSVTDFLSEDIGEIVFWEVYTGMVVDNRADIYTSVDLDQNRVWWDDIYIQDLDSFDSQDASWETPNTGILWYVEWIKKDVLDQLLADQELVNSSICESVLDILIQKRNEWWLKLSVVLIMFVLFSPFMWFVMLLITIIAFILFYIGKKLGIRRSHRVLMEVEEIV